jgi:hypothetical protein
MKLKFIDVRPPPLFTYLDSLIDSRSWAGYCCVKNLSDFPSRQLTTGLVCEWTSPSLEVRYIRKALKEARKGSRNPFRAPVSVKKRKSQVVKIGSQKNVVATGVKK